MRGDRAAATAADPALVVDARRRYPDHVVEAAGLGRADAVGLLVELGWDVKARAAAIRTTPPPCTRRPGGVTST
jgi:hypothetical protein